MKTFAVIFLFCICFPCFATLDANHTILTEIFEIQKRVKQLKEITFNALAETLYETSNVITGNHKTCRWITNGRVGKIIDLCIQNNSVKIYYYKDNAPKLPKEFTGDTWDYTNYWMHFIIRISKKRYGRISIDNEFFISSETKDYLKLDIFKLKNNQLKQIKNYCTIPLKNAVVGEKRILSSNDIVVGIMDTGVDITNNYFKDNFIYNENGQIIYINELLTNLPMFDSKRKNIYNNTGHGTRVAGVVVKINKAVKIIPIKNRWYGKSLSNTTLKLKSLRSEGINTRIINMSLAWGPYYKKEDVNQEVVSSYRRFFRENKDILFVVAAGNENANLDNTPVYPCNLSIEFDNVVCVGSYSGRAKSNRSSSFVDVITKGSFRNLPDSHYQNRKYIRLFGSNVGTSFAAPYITAILSKELEKYPSLSPKQLKNILCNLATSGNSVWNIRNRCGKIKYKFK